MLVKCNVKVEFFSQMIRLERKFPFVCFFNMVLARKLGRSREIAAFLLCALVVSGASCPEEEDLYPCSCLVENGEVEVHCSGKGINQQDIKKALSRMEGTQIAEMSLSQLRSLGKLKGDLFSGHNIRKLEFLSCDVEALTDGEQPAFSGLEDSLQELVIMSSLEGSHTLQLSHLRTLREVALTYNKLNKLEEIRFPTSLTGLDLLRNGIKSLPDHAFSNLINLRELAITGNEFNAFRRNWLPETNNELWCLMLNDNNLTSLPRDAFSNMPSLRPLTLESNSITTLEYLTWAGVWQQLNAIGMRGNPLVCDSNMEWVRQVLRRGLIYGTCHEPANLAGVELHEWIRLANASSNEKLFYQQDMWSTVGQPLSLHC